VASLDYLQAEKTGRGGDEGAALMSFSSNEQRLIFAKLVCFK